MNRLSPSNYRISLLLPAVLLGMTSCGFESPLVHADRCNDYVAKSHEALKAKNYAQAEQLLQSAKDEAAKSDDVLLRPMVMTELAGAKSAQHQYREAETILRKALVLYRELSNIKLNQDQREDLDRDRIATAMKVGDACLEGGKPDEAAEAYKEALADSQKSVGNLYSQHKLIQHYAEMLRKIGKEEDAEQVEAEYQANDPDMSLHVSWINARSALATGTPADADKYLRVIAVAGRQLGEPIEQLTALRWIVQCEKWRKHPAQVAEYTKKIQALTKITKMRMPRRIDETQLALAWAIEDPPDPIVLKALEKVDPHAQIDIYGKLAVMFEKYGEREKTLRLRAEISRLDDVIKHSSVPFKSTPNPLDLNNFKDEINQSVPRN
jgi:tetratricopeptide (TPR) repeat protein